jgi:hypothetical protein
MMRQTSCSTYILLCLTVTVGGPTGEESLTGKKTSARRGGLHVTNTKFTNYAINSLTQSDPIHSTRHISARLVLRTSAPPLLRTSAPPLLLVPPRELDTPAEPTLEPPIWGEHEPRRELETENLAESLEELAPARELAAEPAGEAVRSGGVVCGAAVCGGGQRSAVTYIVETGVVRRSGR